MRVDRPMADLVVRKGKRILVVAALESTLGPTRELLASSARVANVDVQQADLLVRSAWAHFERGDRGPYVEAVAEAIRAGRGNCDVVVLAQASMSPAAELCTDLGVYVLSSPLIGVQAAIAAAVSSGRAAAWTGTGVR
jgi:hypothetical protein